MEKVWMLRHGAFSPVSAEKQGGTPPRFTLWGVVNVTPDSFFDGGTHDSLERAVPHALSLAADGARVLVTTKMKNVYFQKTKLSEEGYTEFVEY